MSGDIKQYSALLYHTLLEKLCNLSNCNCLALLLNLKTWLRQTFFGHTVSKQSQTLLCFEIYFWGNNLYIFSSYNFKFVSFYGEPVTVIYIWGWMDIGSGRRDGDGDTAGSTDFTWLPLRPNKVIQIVIYLSFSIQFAYLCMKPEKIFNIFN